MFSDTSVKSELTWPGRPYEPLRGLSLLIALSVPVIVLMTVSAGRLNPILRRGNFAVNLLAFVILLFVPLIYLTLRRRRVRLGLWRLDGEGVHFTPVDSPTVLIRWSDVHRVKWSSSLVVLEGAGTTMPVSLEQLPEPQRARLRSAIQLVLSEAFDLTAAPPEHISLPRLVRLAVVRLGWMIALGIALAPWFLRTSGHTTWWRSDILVLTWLFCLALASYRGHLFDWSRRSSWIYRRRTHAGT